MLLKPGTGNRERETGNRERQSGNECTAVIPIKIQNKLFNTCNLKSAFKVYLRFSWQILRVKIHNRN